MNRANVFWYTFSILGAVCLSATPLLQEVTRAQEVSPAKDKTAALEAPAAKKPDGGDALEIKTGPLTLVETLNARVEAQASTEVRTDMDAWTSLIVESVIPQGTAVKAGDVVLRFETDKLDDQIRSTEQDLALARLSLQQAVEDLDVYKKLHALDEQLAETKWNRLLQDTKYFFDVQRKLSEKGAEMQRKSAEYSVENAEEELKQLEKMYEEDELTEESEAIVLKRAQRALEQARFFQERALADVGRTLEVELPRQDENQREALERGELERTRGKIAHPAELKKKELDLAKQKYAVEKQERELAKLQADLERMTLKAPAAGVVYYGQCKRGQWVSRSGGTSRMIDVGATIPKDIVILTIVSSGPVQLRADLSEKQAALLKAGAAGIAKAAATGSESLPVTVKSVDPLPIDEGKYDGALEFVNPPGGLLAGMTCEVKIPVFQGTDVIMVPKTAVFSDDSGISNYVYIAGDGTSDRRDVIVGRANGDDLEIVSGLKAGEKILKKKPE